MANIVGVLRIFGDQVTDTQQPGKQLALKEIICPELHHANLAIKEAAVMTKLTHPQLVTL